MPATPLRVLLCANQFGSVPNGPAKFAVLLLEMQRAAAGRSDVHFAVLTEDRTPSPVDGPEVFYVNVPAKKYLPQAALQLVRARAYQRRAAELNTGAFPFDVLLFNNVTNAIGLSADRPYRVVGMLNDYNNLEPDFFQRYGKLTYWSRRALHVLERRAAHTADMVVANSEFLREKIITIYDLPAGRVTKLYKAVDMEGISYRERTLPHPGERVRVLYVKTNYQRGGLPVLLTALGSLSDRQFELCVVGSGKEFLTFYQAKYGQLPENVALVLSGRQPQEVVFSHMREVDIFCVPALTEALGVANIEAMAHGLPVVTSDAGGIPEVTLAGKHAWTAPAGDAAGLAAAFRGCLANPEETLAKASSARTFVENNFSRAAAYRNFSRLLHAAAQQNELTTA